MLCGQAADAPPLAPGAAAGQSPTARPAWSAAACGRDAQPDPPAGAGEPSLGLYAHPGRAAEARNQRLGHHGRDHVARLGPRAGAAADRPQLVRVPARTSAEHARRRSPLRARWPPRGQRVREERCNSGRRTPRSGSRRGLHQRCPDAVALLAAGVRSAAAVGSLRSALSLRLDGRAAAVIAAMACARWTKDTHALPACANGRPGCQSRRLRARRASRNHRSGSRGRCPTVRYPRRTPGRPAAPPSSGEPSFFYPTPRSGCRSPASIDPRSRITARDRTRSVCRRSQVLHGGDSRRRQQMQRAAPAALCKLDVWASTYPLRGNDVSSVCGLRWSSFFAPATATSLNSQTIRPRLMSDS